MSPHRRRQPVITDPSRSLRRTEAPGRVEDLDALLMAGTVDAGTCDATSDSFFRVLSPLRPNPPLGLQARTVRRQIAMRS